MTVLEYVRAGDRNTRTFLIEGATSKASNLMEELKKARQSLSEDEMDDDVSDSTLNLRSANLSVANNAIRTGNLAHAFEALRCFWSDVIAKDLPRPKAASANDIAMAATKPI
jgi:hypothetical protein